VATDAAIESDLPRFDLNDPDAIAQFILDHLEKAHEARLAVVR
jgi:hypothetical protein